MAHTRRSPFLNWTVYEWNDYYSGGTGRTNDQQKYNLDDAFHLILGYLTPFYWQLK